MAPLLAVPLDLTLLDACSVGELVVVFYEDEFVGVGSCVGEQPIMDWVPWFEASLRQMGAWK